MLGLYPFGSSALHPEHPEKHKPKSPFVGFTCGGREVLSKSRTVAKEPARGTSKKGTLLFGGSGFREDAVSLLRKEGLGFEGVVHLTGLNLGSEGVG